MKETCVQDFLVQGTRVVSQYVLKPEDESHIASIVDDINKLGLAVSRITLADRDISLEIHGPLPKWLDGRESYKPYIPPVFRAIET